MEKDKIAAKRMVMVIFIFDDIHWSQEMEEAWQIIKQHPQVKVTIDIFFMGIVFLKKELQKEDFRMRY